MNMRERERRRGKGNLIALEKISEIKRSIIR